MYSLVSSLSVSKSCPGWSNTVQSIPVVQPTGLRYPIRWILFSGINISETQLNTQQINCITPKHSPIAVAK